MFEKFDKYAPQMIADLIADFKFTDWQAAAFPGQTAAESAWMTDIIEDAAVRRGWAGGTGWFQWTGMKEGDRREEFEDWIARKRWRADSYEANYSYLYRELKGYSGTEKRIVDLVKATNSLEEATDVVCRKFLRPGDPDASIALRIKGAKRALEKFRANPPKPTVWPTDKPKEAKVTTLPNIPIGGTIGTAVDGPAGAIIGSLLQAIVMAAAKAEVPIAPEQASQVTAEVVQELQKIPQFQHVASTEEWYQSRANWSAIIGVATALGTPILTVVGVKWDWFTPEFSAALATSLATAGGLIAAFFARRARTATKPLFTKEVDTNTLVLQQLQAMMATNTDLQRQVAELRTAQTRSAGG